MDASQDAIDLTDYEVPVKRSKRAADKFSRQSQETIEIGMEVDSPEPQAPAEPADILQEIRNSYEETQANKPKQASRRKKGDPPAPKRLTYKQALKVVQLTPTSAKKAKSPPKKRKSPAKRASAPSRVTSAPPRELPPPTSSYRSASTAIDLTGEVELTDKHSSAPLFQKHVPVQKPKVPVVDESESDIDLDLDLDTVRVKVQTEKGIESFPTRQHQNFHHIFSALAKKANVSVTKILIYNGDTRVNLDDTPHSVGVKFSTIFRMSVMNIEMRESIDDSAASKRNQIEIKFQWDKDKVDYRSARNKLENSLMLKVSKLDTFKSIIDMLCEKLKIESSRVTLSFDGDEVVKTETPEDLEFDGGETMDCKITKA